jgi:hypothetical protein
MLWLMLNQPLNVILNKQNKVNEPINIFEDFIV